LTNFVTFLVLKNWESFWFFSVNATNCPIFEGKKSPYFLYQEIENKNPEIWNGGPLKIYFFLAKFICVSHNFDLKIFLKNIHLKIYIPCFFRNFCHISWKKNQ
jgi:hypothetical protein